jgi:rhodanese-related sulfurtransferase
MELGAASEREFHATNEGARSSGCCGIYAAFGAMRSLGVDVQLHTLQRPEYLGSLGSTIEQLLAVFRDNHVAGKAFQGLTAFDVANAPGPTILNVSVRAEEREFNHWVLCLGVHPGGGFRIVDWSSKYHPAETRWSEAKLLSRWNGIGIVVTRTPVNPFEVTGMRMLVGFTVAVVGFVLIRFFSSTPLYSAIERCGVAWHMAFLVGLAAILSIGLHVGASSGFVWNCKYVQQVAVRFRTAKFSEIGLDDVQTSLAGGSTQFVDARLAGDFADGSLPGAVNVPVDWPDVEELVSKLGLQESKQTIVFCANPECTWSHVVGRRLESEGFSDVKVYPGGWAEYSPSVEKSNRK